MNFNSLNQSKFNKLYLNLILYFLKCSNIVSTVTGFPLPDICTYSKEKPSSLQREKILYIQNSEHTKLLFTDHLRTKIYTQVYAE